ncbi:copper transporter [Roridomyces roridus]|uniref:Copper transporter n=1 Tax=Roridomyces roridus TaxID=1738132 RepID=A0AAD7B2A2_9AGAR|nr:copper transporter [Roridomyces roridus]
MASSTSSADAFHDALHWGFTGDHVLFSSIHVDSLGGFLLGALLTSLVCALERLLTFASEHHWSPGWVARSRGANALWRSGMYSVVVSLRLAYMLIAMSMHAGLLLVLVATLGICQFFIELRTPHRRDLHNYTSIPEPDCEDVHATFQRPRSRSKPEIFIHPMQSNLARADAAALTMGLANDTERVDGVGTRYPHEAAAWEAGTGPDVARSLLGNGKGPRRTPFQIGGDEDSDGDSV